MSDYPLDKNLLPKPETATKSGKGRLKQSRSGVKSVRNQIIMVEAMKGRTVTDIAEELNLSRQQVSRILNSEEITKRITEIDGRLIQGLDDAIVTVLTAVKTDYLAARDLLRNFGSMSAQIRLHHSGSSTLEDLVAGSSEPSDGVE